jgi:hypothetical protein
MFGDSIEKFFPRLFEIGIDFVQASLRVALIIGAAYVGLRLLRLGFNRLETLLVRAAAAAEVVPGTATKRIRTLMSVLWTIVVGLVWFVAVWRGHRRSGHRLWRSEPGQGSRQRFLSNPRESSPRRRRGRYQRHRRIGGSDLVSHHRLAR